MDTESRRSQLEADLAEADRLLALTDNVRLTTVITSFRGQVLRDLQSLPERKPQVAAQPAKAEVVYRNIDRWAWEQSTTWVKIYVTSLPDLTDIPNEDLQLTSTRDSVDFKIMNVNGVNYRLFFKQLAKTVSKVTFKTRRDGFVLKLDKSPMEPWNVVEFQPTERIKSPNEYQDPLTKARNIILDEYDKVRYTQGDDRTRRLIGQAMAGKGEEQRQKILEEARKKQQS